MKYIWAFILISSTYADEILPVFNKYMDNEALSENIPVGQSVYKLEGSFGNDNRDLLYGLEGTDYLVVDSNTGVVTIAKPLDHEKSDTLKFNVTLQQKNGGDVFRLSTSVIILDENDNAPIFKNTPYEGSVNEESQSGTTVFKWIHVEDLDKVGEPLEVRCESNIQNDDGCLKFKIQPMNVSESYYLGVLVVNGDIQYSENQIYKLLLVASDGIYETKVNVDIYIRDIQNTPPVFYGSLTTVINEDVLVGTRILTVNAKDGDRGEPRNIVYDLIQNPTDYFSLDGITGDLSTAKLIDRESLSNNNGIITLIVRAREVFNGSALDDKLSSSIAIITITVQDVNDEPPVFNKRDYFVLIPENIAPGTPLPNLNMSVVDSDIGMNSEFSLKLLDESKLFVIEPNKAIGSVDVGIKLASNVKLDYEDPNQRKFIVLVIASEPSEKYDLTSTATLTIQITDVNDNPPEFDNNAYTLTVNETASPGTIVGVVKATDRDSNSNIIYKLSGPSADKFYVEKTTGTISVALCSNIGKAPCLDYEVQSNYYLTYIATDDNGNGQSNSVTIMVMLIDSNDNPPIFMQHIYTSLIDEGVTIFEPPIIVHAIDADKSSFINYSIKSGNEKQLFKIDPNSGEILILSSNGLQKSKDDNITLIVTANDGMFNDEATVKIIVLDVNNNSPQFLSDSYNVSIYENVPVGYSVLKVEAIDEDLDINANLTYHIQEGSFNHFSIDHITGFIYTSSKLDFDQHSNYAITTLAIDKGTPALTGSSTVFISITNVNNKSPEFVPIIQRTEISEDVPVGTVIYRLVAHDPDINDENSLNFFLNSSAITGVSSNGNQLDDNSEFKNWFKIRTSNGDVIIMETINRNIVATISLSIIVIDTSAPDVQQSTGTLMVTIIDVNDIPPIFEAPWTKENPYYKTSVLEEQPISSVIGMFTATDDSGIDHYNIVPINSFIGVNQTTGVLYTKEKLDFESIESIDINLIAYDTGNPQLSTTATIFIKILNINDNNPIFHQTEYKAEIEENSSVGTFVTNVTATDADKGLFGLVHYSIIDNNYGFTIDQDTGVVKVNDSSFLDREISSELLLTVQAKDEAPTDMAKSVTVLLFIKLIDVNDNPPEFDPKTYSLSIIASTPTTPLLQLKAIDKDLNSKLTYTIDSGNQDLFILDKDSGFLYSAMSLNGKKGSYLFEVNVFDGIFWDKANVNITVLDVNQNQPVFVHPSINNSTLYIPEDISVGSLILTVCAEDKDFGENGHVNYFFKVSNLNAQQTDTFIINPETGQIKTQILLDYETKSSYELVLVARDQGSPTWHESLKLLTINLIDVNDNKPQFLTHNENKPSYIFSIRENNKIQYKIGQVKAIDLDQGDNAHIFYYLITDKPIPFIIDRLDGTIYANNTLDREKQSSYEIIIKASNDNEYQHLDDLEVDDNSVAKVLILVTDENDNAPVFQANHYYAGVNTMAKVGDVILQVTAIDLDYEENSTVTYYIDKTQLFKPGVNNITWSSILKDPFSIDQSGRISTAVFLAEYNQGRFDLQITSKENASPYRISSTIVTVWVYETHQLVKLIVSRAPQTVNEGREQILSSLANVTNMIVVLDDVRYHVNQYGYIQPDWSDVYLHLVDPMKNDIMSSWEVLTIIDDKYDYLKDYYQNFAIENVVPALIVTQSESFEPTIAALVALLVVLTVGCIGVMIICCCFRHWMFSELDNNSIKNDILIKKTVIDDLSTTENPLWIEQKLKLYEEQELTMQVFCDLENKEMPINHDNMGDNTYATIRRPSRRGSINTLLTMTPGEYATLGGSVLPLPPGGETSHSQQMFEASLGFQGSTFQVPDSALDTSNLLISNSDI